MYNTFDLRRVLCVTVVALLLSFVSTTSFAMESFPNDVDYIQVAQDLHANAAQIENFFEARGYLSAKFNGEALPLYQINWANRVYINPKGTGFVIFKAFVGTTKPIKLNELYKTKDGYLIHIASGERNRVHALYFTGMSLDSVLVETKALTKFGASSRQRDLPHNLYSVAKLLIPSAYASESASLCLPVDHGQSAFVVATKIINAGGGCISGIIGGVWNGSLGGLILIGKGAFQAVVHPVKTFESVSAEFKKTAHFIETYSSSMDRFQADFKALPADAQAKIICESIATLGTAFLLPGLLLRELPAILAKVAATLPGASAVKVAEMAQKVSANAKGVAAQLAMDQTIARIAAHQKVLRELQDRLNSLESELHFAKKVEDEATERAWKGLSSAHDVKDYDWTEPISKSERARLEAEISDTERKWSAEEQALAHEQAKLPSWSQNLVNAYKKSVVNFPMLASACATSAEIGQVMHQSTSSRSPELNKPSRSAK